MANMTSPARCELQDQTDTDALRAFAVCGSKNVRQIYPENNPNIAVTSPPATPLFTETFILAQIKENVKAPSQWPLWVEFTSDWLIPRTKSQ